MATLKTSTYSGRYLQLDVWQDGEYCAWKLQSINETSNTSKYFTIYNLAVIINDYVAYAPYSGTNSDGTYYYGYSQQTFPAATGETSGSVYIGQGKNKKDITCILQGSVYTNGGKDSPRKSTTLTMAATKADVNCQIRYMDAYGNYGNYSSYATNTVTIGQSTSFSRSEDATYEYASVSSGTISGPTTVYMSVPRKTHYFNMNINDPNGYEQYYGGAGSVEISIDGGNSYSRVYNENISYPHHGRRIYFRNFSPDTGMHLNTVTGANSWSKSSNSGYVDMTEDKEVNFNTAWNTYTVKYNANGGSGSMSNTSATYNTSFNLRSNSFTRTGYSFGGWATSASGGAAYSNGQSVSNLTATDGGTVNLYAVWNVTKPYSLGLSRTGSTTTSISFSLSASGIGVNNYAIYYRKGTSGSFSGVSSTQNTITINNLEPDTNYQFYMGAANSAGQTTLYQDSPVTYSTLLGNPTIGTPTVSNLLPFSCTISAAGSISPSRTLTYRFSKDGGSTWTSYQTGNSYNWTGLAEETSYNMAVQVKATHAGTNASDTTAVSYLTITTPADQAKIRKKEDGSWIKGKGWTKINGEWTKMKKIYKKVNGQWVIGHND